METKITQNLNVKGKDGLTKVFTIQRHKPTAPMCFIRTVTGHMLFCQEDHPIWVQTIDGQTNIVEAKDAVTFHDRIWVDNTNLKIDLIDDQDSAYNTNFFMNLLLIISGIDESNISKKPEYFLGDSKYNFYINPEFFSNISKLDANIIISHFLNYRYKTTLVATEPEKHKIYSFNFVSQLKSLADFLQHTCSFNINFEKDNVYWTMYDTRLSNKPINEISEYVDIEQVISGIENYNGYVYDIKTESEEFLNNSVQTHNSFHCFHSDSIVEVHGFSIDSQGFSLESLFDFASYQLDLPIRYDVPFSNGMTQDEIDIPDDVPMKVPTTVDGRYTTTKVKKIIRHKQDPTTKMITVKYFMPSLGYGKSTEMSVVSQDNHKHFKIVNGIPVLTEAKDLKRDDYIWVYNYTDHIQLCKIHAVYNVPNLDDDEYVYDLTTESGTLFVNSMYTHNTGGAVEFKKIDILKELSKNITDSDEGHLRRLFNQTENDLYCNNDLTKITVNKDIFKDEYALKKEGGKVKLPLGYFNIHTGSLRLEATIEQEIELEITDDFSETHNTIEIVYGSGDKILHAKSFSISPEKIAQHLDKLVGGKSPYTSPESLLMKFHNDLAQFNNYDMTHLEVIVASILRNRLDPMIPARLKEPYDPVTFSIKTLPGTVSWSLGIAFENISKSITTGMISDDTKNLSQIEKVLFGEPLSELSIEKLKDKRTK